MTDTKSADTANHGKLDQTIDAAERAYGRTVDTASQTIESSPLGIVAGGLALGALAGALLPRSDKEKELLAPIGKQLGERVRAATQAARSAGQEEFANLGLTKDGAKDQVKTLFEGVTKALSTAGAAAAKSAANKA
jgi:hypothetical protein